MHSPSLIFSLLFVRMWMPFYYLGEEILGKKFPVNPFHMNKCSLTRPLDFFPGKCLSIFSLGKDLQFFSLQPPLQIIIHAIGRILLCVECIQAKSYFHGLTMSPDPQSKIVYHIGWICPLYDLSRAFQMHQILQTTLWTTFC